MGNGSFCQTLLSLCLPHLPPQVEKNPGVDTWCSLTEYVAMVTDQKPNELKCIYKHQNL
jgi:hypothetical protein